MDNDIYARFTDTLDREKNTVSVDDYMSIPGKAGDIAIRWRDGDDIWGSDRFKKSFKYKVRRELLNYGIDIKQPCDVTRLATKVKVITLEESNAPSWYWGESKTDWSKAA